MQSTSLYRSEKEGPQQDTAAEIARLQALLEEARRELTRLQEEMRVFRARYTEVVGSRLAELSEIEREIKRAERRMLGLETEETEESAAGAHDDEVGDEGHASHTVRGAMRKLFWSVAKMFHPDHAADEREAQRRHTIMAEASRAYREGDVESLHTLLGDEHLQSLCAVGLREEEADDMEARLLGLEIELRTVQFGIKRIKLDGLYSTMLRVKEDALGRRDTLAHMAEQIDRQIVKARHRLANLV